MKYKITTQVFPQGYKLDYDKNAIKAPHVSTTQ